MRIGSLDVAGRQGMSGVMGCVAAGRVRSGAVVWVRQVTSGSSVAAWSRVGGFWQGGSVRSLVAGIGDAELSGVLILAGSIDDQLNTVASLAWCKIRGRSPEV